MRLGYGLSVIMCVCLWFTASYATGSKAPIPAKQAFIFSIYSERQQLILNWQIAPDYFLYKDRIKIRTQPKVDLQIDYPQGDFKYSEDLGRYEVYKNSLTIPIKLPLLTEPTKVKVTYQGCAADGFCYPPISKLYLLNAELSLTPIANTKPEVKKLLTNQQQVAALFNSQHIVVLFLLFVALGLLLAFTPCVLPMVPILTSIIIGQQKEVTTKKAFLLSLTYVLGMALTYAMAGVLVTKIGGSLQVWLQKPWIIVSVSILFVLLAFSLFGFYHLRLPRSMQHRLTHLSNQLPGGSYLGVFFMGVISTLIVSPCVTAPLVGVLVYIGQTGDMLLGASALFAIGLGMGIPLLVIGMSAGKWLPKHGPWMEAVKMAFGMMMLAMSVWLITRILTATQSVMLWGAFLLIVAFFVGLYFPRMYKRHFVHRTISIIVALIGIFLILSTEFLPMPFGYWMNKNVQTNAQFITVKNMTSLNEQLRMADKMTRPVLIDFYADWCESCIAMERKVFANPQVMKTLLKENYVLIRADLSGNSNEEQEMMTQFNIIAPPTILFFNHHGKEIPAARIVGEVPADEFLTRLP